MPLIFPTQYLPIIILIPVLAYASLLDLRGRRVPKGIWVPWVIVAVPAVVTGALLGMWYNLMIAGLLVLIIYIFAQFQVLGGGDVIGFAAAIPATTLVIDNPYWCLVLTAIFYLVGLAPLIVYRKWKGIEDSQIAMMPFIALGATATFMLSVV